MKNAVKKLIEIKWFIMGLKYILKMFNSRLRYIMLTNCSIIIGISNVFIYFHWHWKRNRICDKIKTNTQTTIYWKYEKYKGNKH